MTGNTTDISGLSFQDSAMSTWVNIQTMSENSRDLREVSQAHDTIKFFLFSIFVTITYANIVSESNWNLALVLFISLEIITISRLVYLKRRRDELLTRHAEIKKFCESRGIFVPKGYNKLNLISLIYSMSHSCLFFFL